MSENRIVTELFFEKPTFEEVSRVSRLLEEKGVKTMMVPPDDRGINTHLVIETADLDKVKEMLAKMDVKIKDKEVILIHLQNRPGTMAEAAKRISDTGINLTYAFSVIMTPEESYILLGTEDNKAALKALQS